MCAKEGEARRSRSTPSYEVLLVSADHVAAERLADRLDRRSPGRFAVHRCTPAQADAQVRRRTPSCVVLVLGRGDDGLARLRGLRAAMPGVPVVVLGDDDEGTATSLLHEGAQDHLPSAATDGRTLARAIRAAIERSAGDRALAHEALHDELTGLPNRRLCMDRLAVALRHAARLRLSIPVLFIDLDGFKAVNDHLGHEAGDAVLVEVAGRLVRCVRAADTVARLGGDEFVVISPDHTTPEEAAQLAQRLADAVCTVAYCDSDDVLAVTPSIGIALSDGGEPGADALIREADAAMYRAKRVTGSAIAFAGRRETRDAGPIDPAELERALERGELVLHFQPQLELAGHQVTGFEALVRWEHPDRGMLLPAEFLPLAESAGLAGAIDDWVIATACERLVEWSADVGELTVSVNVSPRALASSSTAGTVRRVLACTALDAGRVTIEFTEKTLLRAGTRAAAHLRALHSIGVRLALDDFGSDQASLALLAGLPLDEVKIDPAHLATLQEAAPAGTRMLDLVARVAGLLHLDLVAECVETLDQLDDVTLAGCVRGQGHVLGRPANGQRVAGLLRAGGVNAF
jgi:diguanylate cyclase (GGDEF)-like protein